MKSGRALLAQFAASTCGQCTGCSPRERSSCGSRTSGGHATWLSSRVRLDPIRAILGKPSISTRQAIARNSLIDSYEQGEASDGGARGRCARTMCRYTDAEDLLKSSRFTPISSRVERNLIGHELAVEPSASRESGAVTGNHRWQFAELSANDTQIYLELRSRRSPEPKPTCKAFDNCMTRPDLSFEFPSASTSAATFGAECRLLQECADDGVVRARTLELH